jgi:hypothetical protein
MLDHALAYARLGIRIIPIKPGQKYPPIPQWQNKATWDEPTIRDWWTNQYADYGIGIATGHTRNGNIFVIDVDDREHHSGSETLEALQERYGQLPETVEAQTGSGGRHLYYYTPVTIRNDAGTRLGPGLDIRGEGGQVLADPTIHPNGRPYTWIDGQSPHERKPAQAPQWLTDLLTKQPQPIKPPTTDTFLNDPTSPSARYNAETTWHQLLTADGWTLAKTDRHGEQHWTRPGKDPREGTSATIGHNGNDALIVFTSSIPWLPEGGYNRFGYMAARDHGGDWKQAAHHYLQTNPTPTTTPTIPSPDEMLSMLIDWRTFWTQDHQAEDWIAKPLIARARQTALFAGAKTGKSWVTLNIVAALATGKPILGQPAQPPVHVLYLDYEMVEADLYERLEQFGYTEDDDYSHLHYALIPNLPPLNTQEGAAAVMRLTELTKAEVVVIDTTGRAIDGEENSADSYREFARTTGLALKRAGIACVRTDHAGKDGGKKLGQRGSSAKNDDVDIVYRLDKNSDGLTLVRTHSRIGWCPPQVDLVVDDLGDTTTIRLKAQPTGFTPLEIEWARRLDEHGFPREASLNQIVQEAKERGIKLVRRTTLAKAIQARQMPRPDEVIHRLDSYEQVVPKNREPLGNHPQNREPLGNHLGNHFVEPIPDKGTGVRLYINAPVPDPPRNREPLGNHPDQNTDDIW